MTTAAYTLSYRSLVRLLVLLALVLIGTVLADVSFAAVQGRLVDIRVTPSLGAGGPETSSIEVSFLPTSALLKRLVDSQRSPTPDLSRVALIATFRAASGLNVGEPTPVASVPAQEQAPIQLLRLNAVAGEAGIYVLAVHFVLTVDGDQAQEFERPIALDTTTTPWSVKPLKTIYDRYPRMTMPADHPMNPTGQEAQVIILNDPGSSETPE